MVDSNGSRASGIGEHEHLLSPRILDRNVTEGSRLTLSLDPASPTFHEPGEVRQGPVLAATNDLLRVGVDDHNAATGIRSDVRLIVLIRGKYSQKVQRLRRHWVGMTKRLLPSRRPLGTP